MGFRNGRVLKSHPPHLRIFNRFSDQKLSASEKSKRRLEQGFLTLLYKPHNPFSPVTHGVTRPRRLNGRRAHRIPNPHNSRHFLQDWIAISPREGIECDGRDRPSQEGFPGRDSLIPSRAEPMTDAIGATRNEWEQSNRRQTAERRFRFFGERPQKVPFAHTNQTHQKRIAFVMESSGPDRTGRFMVMQSRQVEREVKRPIRIKGHLKTEVARA
jgi:hypothetical protein